MDDFVASRIPQASTPPPPPQCPASGVETSCCFHMLPLALFMGLMSSTLAFARAEVQAGSSQQPRVCELNKFPQIMCSAASSSSAPSSAEQPATSLRSADLRNFQIFCMSWPREKLFFIFFPCSGHQSFGILRFSTCSGHEKTRL